MRTWGEIVGLANDALRLWRRFLPQLVFWFSLGYAVNLAGRYASTKLGGDQLLLGNLCVGASIIATACATLLMMNTVGPGLPTYQRLLGRVDRGSSTDGGGTPPEIPLDVAQGRGRLDVLAAVVGPVLAIYSVWNLVADEAKSLFFLNFAVQGPTPQSPSIDFGRVDFYLKSAVVVWVVRTVLGRITRHLSARGSGATRVTTLLAPLYIFLEGLWVYLVFVALYSVTTDVKKWWSERAVVGWMDQAWETVTGWLPTIVIPLPEAVRSAASWVFGTLLPGAFEVVGLPLVFLAVTATVFGWQGSGLSRAAAAGLARIQPQLERIPVRPQLVPGRGLRVVADFLADDLRTKYLPLFQSLWMLVRAGIRVLGGFLVLASFLSLMQAVLSTVGLRLFGPADGIGAVTNESILTLLVGLVIQPLLVALYAASFDRALRSVDARAAGAAAEEARAAEAGDGVRKSTEGGRARLHRSAPPTTASP